MWSDFRKKESLDRRKKECQGRFNQPCDKISLQQQNKQFLPSKTRGIRLSFLRTHQNPVEEMSSTSTSSGIADKIKYENVVVSLLTHCVGFSSEVRSNILINHLEGLQNNIMSNRTSNITGPVLLRDLFKKIDELSAASNDQPVNKVMAQSSKDLLMSLAVKHMGSDQNVVRLIEEIREKTNDEEDTVTSERNEELQKPKL